MLVTTMIVQSCRKCGIDVYLIMYTSYPTCNRCKNNYVEDKND